jgi:WD40 repeat protein
MAGQLEWLAVRKASADVILNKVRRRPRINQDGRLGQPGSINSVVFSSDGERILTAGDNNVAHLWTSQSARLLFSFEGHSAAVNAAVLSPDGQRVVTCSKDKTARL